MSKPKDTKSIPEKGLDLSAEKGLDLAAGKGLMLYIISFPKCGSASEYSKSNLIREWQRHRSKYEFLHPTYTTQRIKVHQRFATK